LLGKKSQLEESSLRVRVNVVARELVVGTEVAEPDGLLDIPELGPVVTKNRCGPSILLAICAVEAALESIVGRLDPTELLLRKRFLASDIGPCSRS
jgi:hypothetical protein